MKKVIALKINEDDAPWKRIKEVNKIRNLLVHNDGHRINHEGQVRKEAKAVDQLSQRHLYWSDNDLIFGPAYLGYVLNLFDELFQYLDQAIQGITKAAKRD